MPFVLFLLGAAAVGLIAASASASDKGKGGGGGGRTYTLDANLPPQLRQQVLAAVDKWAEKRTIASRSEAIRRLAGC